ncbi:class I SAM-dependent methyltransferase [Streptomyces sp. WAC06614]|uniref:class I SAM-dependent methyltransferase n=1 Tax=Streptomyces sp. WAC06614 TaxID=2487416 RepID=UPI000F77AFAA|nr:class I SAM-dependent methyltransferase [Streptomyces sp. WAC06614]RSS84063.1 methyltransferase domain-containing protein [Streptomyces sp. WAC06614]
MSQQTDTEAHYRRHVLPYYRAFGSRFGYAALLGRTRHFGWYEPHHAPWEFAAAMRRMELVAVRRLGLAPGASVLDAGCGVGDTARTVARAGRAYVTGIDGIQPDLVIARQRSARAGGPGARTRFLRADYHALPFADGSFDGAYTMESFVHSPDPARGLAEFFRVLRPGGRLVMFEYSSTPEAELSPRARSALRRMCALSGMPGMLAMTHGELERLLTRTGFLVEPAYDATAKVLPMLRAFWQLGLLPYSVACGLGRGDRLVNAMSGVEMYRHQEAWRYTICAATRP